MVLSFCLVLQCFRFFVSVGDLCRFGVAQFECEVLEFGDGGLGAGFFREAFATGIFEAKKMAEQS